MKIEVLSQMQVEDKSYLQSLVKNNKYIIISITEPDFRANITTVGYCLGVKRLEFDDLDRIVTDNKYVEDIKEYKVFDSDQAKSILDFIELHVLDIELIVIHCAAGVSRSAGVGCALQYILIGNDYRLVKVRPCYNRHVYRTILNQYFNNQGEYPNIERYFRFYQECDNVETVEDIFGE